MKRPLKKLPTFVWQIALTGQIILNLSSQRLTVSIRPPSQWVLWPTRLSSPRKRVVLNLKFVVNSRPRVVLKFCWRVRVELLGRPAVTVLYRVLLPLFGVVPCHSGIGVMVYLAASGLTFVYRGSGQRGTVMELLISGRALTPFEVPPVTFSFRWYFLGWWRWLRSRALLLRW